MDKKTLVEKTREMMAPPCCAELKEAGQAWIDAIGTEGEKAAAKAYVAELKDDIVPIDDNIAFMQSDAGAKVFGADQAHGYAEHFKEVKAAGGKYCDCPACAAAMDILKDEDVILG